MIVNSSNTLVSEYSLFKAIEERMLASKVNEAIEEANSEPHSH